MSSIPVTIITGFLGAGKTTLLKRILSEEHGQKIAVIENEFGEENIDNEILVTDNDEQIIQMSNGCICCSIREDLRNTLTRLAQEQGAGKLDFERVIIETTGLADPGPVAQTFFMDDAVAENFMLDAIVTLVDARHARQQLNERMEAQRQVGFADRIFISKADLASDEELQLLRRRLQRMNPRAPQQLVHFGQAPLADILDLRGFNLNEKLDLDADFLRAHEDGQDHPHDAGDSTSAHHHHDDDEVKSFVFRARRPFDPVCLEDFLGAIVDIYGPRMLRYKGVLWMMGTEHKVVFQGVHQLMGSDLGPRWAANEARESKMVFIGMDLPQQMLEQGLRQCLQ